MRIQKLVAAMFCLFLLVQVVDAQVVWRGGGRVGMGVRARPARPNRPPKQQLPKYEPTVHLAVGYGLPNLDKNYLPQYYNAYGGSSASNGPVTVAIDYQFSRTMSIGVLVTHGTVTAPYYDYSNAITPVFNARLESWSYMLNLVRYIPSGIGAVTPYFRTAIGINSWKQSYTDPNGNKANVVDMTNLQDLAYQVGFGAKFGLSKHAGLFVEAGYGKYILQGGLSIKL